MRPHVGHLCPPGLTLPENEDDAEQSSAEGRRETIMPEPFDRLGPTVPDLPLQASQFWERMNSPFCLRQFGGGYFRSQLEIKTSVSSDLFSLSSSDCYHPTPFLSGRKLSGGRIRGGAWIGWKNLPPEQPLSLPLPGPAEMHTGIRGHTQTHDCERLAPCKGANLHCFPKSGAP